MARKVALLAAGGTGGHLFPAQALASELARRDFEVHLASDSRASRFVADFPAEAVHTVDAATFGSKNPLAMAKSAWTIWRGVRQASRLIERITPGVVAGFGGYPTLPPLYAATRRGVPTLIHEQNAVMGRANRALARRVDAIAGGFLEEGDGPHSGKIAMTGNPVRAPVLEAAETPYAPSADDEPFRLLVFGGSQGARFFGEAMPAALEALPAAVRKRVVVTQQARAEDEAAVRAAYVALGIEAEIAPFFTDMATRMGGAHLVVSRSGASTVSEMAVIGRPAILVPYPHALDHDQAANAAALERAGGAMVERQQTLTPERLASLLSELMHSPRRLVAMAESAKSVGKPRAAMLLADLTEAIAAGMSVEQFKQGARP